MFARPGRILWLITVLALPPGLLHAGSDATAEKARDPDPWEGMNRRMFAFNEFWDRHLLKPVAKGYQAATPEFVDKGVTNFFGNIEEVPIFINHVLQLRLGKAGKGLGRFLLNSTVGLAGFFDVATDIGITKNETDLGQTLGRWGAEPGPYLVLPFLGPSSFRDGIGSAGGFWMNPITYIDDTTLRWSLRGTDAVDTRADLLKIEELVTGDRYIFIRDSYLQRRQYSITGEVPEEELDEDWLDEE